MSPLPLSHSVHSDHSNHSNHNAPRSNGHASSSLSDMPVVPAHAKPVVVPSAMAESHNAISGAPASAMQAHASAVPTEKTKASRKHSSSTSKKTKKKSSSELTPLILKSASKKSSTSEEEVHPLPWFSSPEWPRKSPPVDAATTNDKRRKNRFRRGRSTFEQTSLCNKIMGNVCCGVVDQEPDLELGLLSRTNAAGEQQERESFKQCVQLLVGLIVVVAAVLIIMIIFQPFQQQSGSQW